LAFFRNTSFSLLAYSHNPFIILLAIIKHTLLSAPYSKDHTTLCLEHCYGINYFSASSIRSNSLLRAQHSKLLPLATIFLSIFRAVKYIAATQRIPFAEIAQQPKMASPSTDPDDATAALIAQMIAADLDAEDAALSYHSNYFGNYDDNHGGHGDGDYDNHTDAPYEAEHESAPVHPADSTWEQYYNNPEDPAHPDEPSTVQVPDGTWDSSEAPLPVKRSKKKQAAAEDQQHEDLAQADESPTAAGSNRPPIEDADGPPNPIPNPLTVNRVAIAHEDLHPHPPPQPPSNAPGKRRADSAPAYRLPHRPHPATLSPPHPPTPCQPTEPVSKLRELDSTIPSNGWGEPAPGSEDWELLEIKIPWPGSERGFGARRVAEMEEEMRRREDAAVVEVRVGEGEDLWSLLGELCLGEENGEGEGEGGDDGGEGDMDGEGMDDFRGLRRWGLEGWVVGGVR